MSPPPNDRPQGQAFRPGEDLAPDTYAAPEPVALAFTPAADAGGTDFDVLMGYQLFLGRDPENSFVIADAKTSPVGAFIRALMGSGEFQSAVLDKLAAGRPVPHESASVAPVAEQLEWLFKLIRLPGTARAELRSAPDWRAWLRILIAVPGFPHAPGRAPIDPAATGVAAHAADEGFVLVHLEQPKAGDRFTPGIAVTGSGWAIAPADVAEVAVDLDGRLLTHARYGLPRPDVARSFPHYRHVDHCGFAFNAMVPAEIRLHPASQLTVSVRTIRGEIGRKSVRLNPPSETSGGPIANAGAPESWPIRLSVDEAVVDASRMLRLRGWAASHEAMHAITASLGDLDLGEVQHGLPRPDIARVHPGYANAGHAGFALVFQLGEDVPAGPGFVRVQAEDETGRTRQTILPVTVPAAELSAGADWEEAHPTLDEHDDGAVAAEPAVEHIPHDMRLEIDHPALAGAVALAPVRGALTLSGWAIGRKGVSAVSVFCDERLLGHAHLGMRREDIDAAFPDYEGALLAGYALVLPPGTLPEGDHDIRIVAAGRIGETTERRFSLLVERYDALPPECAIRTAVPPAETAFALRLLARQDHRPVFEIAIAGADPARLADTLASLARQAYPHWSASVTLPSKKAVAEPGLRDALAAGGERVTATWPGKPAAKRSKAGSEPATPRLVMGIRAGDLLGADALLALAAQSATEPDADFIYADELRIDSAQGRRQPFLKPDWSADLLLAMNYVGRPWCATRALVDRAGLSADSGEYDAVLRLTEHASRIAHVPRVLCERGADADTPEQEQAALTACLARRGVAARVEPGRAAGTWRVRRDLLATKRRRGAKGPVAGRVSIIMPTCAARGLVRIAIKTIRAHSAPAQPGGRDVEIVILDNTPSREGRTRSWLRKQADIVVDMPGPFNWSRFNNEGARAATGEYLLFLNDDIEILQPDWLEAMLEQAQRPEVGVVGARLLYPDGKVQHGGQYLADTHARHAFRFADEAAPGPFGLATVAREMISVTGACQMVRAEVFKRLGGFEEAHSVVNNDLDFCLRSWRAGLSVVFTPHATLIHHELASRAALEDSYDEARFLGAWRERFLKGDPFRNPRLGLDADHYAADPEPTVELHVGRRGPAIGDIRRILAVKLDHIGDLLTALPALRLLAKRFPAAKIDLLAPAASAELARHESVIAETLVFDFFHARSGEGQKGLGEMAFQALRERLAPAAYDMAIDLRMQPETREVLRYTGAAFLVGYDHGGRFPFLDVALEWEGDRRLEAKRAHVSERLVQLVSAAEDACTSDASAPTPASAVHGGVAALDELPDAFLSRRLVCVHPGVGNVVRQWPPGHYAALIDLLAGEGLNTVLIGGPDEAAIAEEVLRRVSQPGTAESLVGRVKLAQLPDVMRACVLFVGNNSGPQHLAASLGMPAIGIHSGVVDAVEWAPLGPQAMALRRRMICGPCYLEFASDCPRDLACLTGLRPAEVFAACLRLLA
jgi:ADP-heptose:LPS heptosyltransferase/GT2 family glycosyltransferase